MKRMIKKIIVMTLSLVLVLINMSYVFAESEAASIVVDDNAFTEISEAMEKFYRMVHLNQVKYMI